MTSLKIMEPYMSKSDERTFQNDIIDSLINNCWLLG